MALATHRRALAPADAYIVFNRSTGIVDLVCGEQADYVLSEIYDDQHVRPERGGVFVVTTGGWDVLKYMPLHGDQTLHRHIAPDAVFDTKLSRDGKMFRDMPRTEGRDLLKFITRHEGRFFRLLDDCILRTHKGRILGIWRPVRAEALAQAA
jgi:hypothetical protein